MTTDVVTETPEPMEHPPDVQFQAVPVKIVNSGDQGANVNLQASDYGAFFSMTVGATDAPKQILPFDENRQRAIVLVGGTGPVYLGTIAQVGASPPLGFVLPTGVMLEVRNNQAVLHGT
jgi:hypothetical protein